jgi:peptide-methionine (R)-S-oxide reductase
MAKYHRNADVISSLSEEEYWVTQQSGTERPGPGKLLSNKEPGV